MRKLAVLFCLVALAASFEAVACGPVAPPPTIGGPSFVCKGSFVTCVTYAVAIDQTYSAVHDGYSGTQWTCSGCGSSAGTTFTPCFSSTGGYVITAVSYFGDGSEYVNSINVTVSSCGGG